MTDIEAIEIFNRKLNAAQAVLDSGFGEHPGESATMYHRNKALYKVAISALQERIDREKGCEWCNGIGKTPENWECSLVGEYGTVTTVDHEVIWTTATVCPVCGRKLKTAMTGEEV